MSMTVVSVASGWNLSSIALEWVSAVIGAVKCPSSFLKFPEFLSPSPSYIYIYLFVLSPLLPQPTKFHTYNDHENSTRTFVIVVKILDVQHRRGMKWRGGREKKRAEIRSQRALGIYEFMATIVIYLCRKTQRFSLSLSLSRFLSSSDRIETISFFSPLLFSYPSLNSFRKSRISPCDIHARQARFTIHRTKSVSHVYRERR